MFDVILFTFGFISLSFFMPIVYFVLLHKGAFEDDKETWRWYTYCTWLVASGISFVICSFIILISEGARNSFVFGCIIGLIVPLLYWIVYLYLPAGRIEINKIRIKKMKCILDRMYYSSLSEVQKEEFNNFNNFIKKAKEANNDIQMKMCKKEMDKIISQNTSLKKHDIRYMNNSDCLKCMREI